MKETNVISFLFLDFVSETGQTNIFYFFLNNLMWCENVTTSSLSLCLLSALVAVQRCTLSLWAWT